LAVVDRQQGGAELYAQHGLAFEALFSIVDLQAHCAARSAQP
jgi:orotate phosphoribosyltransferase